MAKKTKKVEPRLDIVKDDKELKVTKRVYELIYQDLGYHIVELDAEVKEADAKDINELAEQENLQDLTVKELQERAKGLHLEGYTNLKKDDLIKLIEG